MSFEQSHLYEEVPYDPSKGYPGHFGLYYRCPLCGDIIASSPPTSMACGCGNLLIEVGQMRVRHADRQPSLLKKKNLIKRLFGKRQAVS